MIGFVFWLLIQLWVGH